jgi:hypothetical protein
VDVYQLILDGSEDNCRLALETEMDRSAELYHGAAAACLAALHGRSQRWTDAGSALDALDGPPEGCLDRQIYDLLQFAVHAYRANPQARFEIERNSNTVAPRCPTIGDVTVTRNSTGELEVLVRGARLGRVLRIAYKSVDSCPVPVDTPVTTSVEPIEQTRESVRAVVDSSQGLANATFLWAGLIAAPDPWVADGKCVAIVDAGAGLSDTASPQAF